MPPVDDRTTNRNYQKPNIANSLAEDVVRLRAALDSIDSDIPARDSSSQTINLINGANGTTTITLPRSCFISSIESDKAATIILYSTSAAAAADNARAWATVPPAAGSGVIAQVTLAAAGTQALDPSPPAINKEGTPSNTYTIRVVNNGTSGNVVVTIAYLKLEV